METSKRTKVKAGYGQDRPKATACWTSEGRESIARWNPKGHEEKYRAVIDGKPKMNRSAKGGQGRVCTSETKAFSFTHRTTVFADGTVQKNNA